MSTIILESQYEEGRSMQVYMQDSAGDMLFEVNGDEGIYLNTNELIELRAWITEQLIRQGWEEESTPHAQAQAVVEGEAWKNALRAM